MKPVEGSPFTPDDVLEDPRRMEEELWALPRALTVKGMFLQPLVERLGRGRFDQVRWSLLDAPREGYLAFADYPQRDHRRLLALVAELEFPGVAQAEALRRVARRDIEVLAGSTFGRVIMAAVGGPAHALSLFPTVYARVAPGMDVSAERLSPRRVRLDFVPVPGGFCYQLGQIEGVAAHYGARTQTTVYERPGHRIRFDVALL